jgi:hypothetical protein
MRETQLAKAGQKMLVRTDDRGTQLRGVDAIILAEYGTDQHDRLIAEYQQQGWRSVQERDVRPGPAGMADPNMRPGLAVGSDGEDA